MDNLALYIALRKYKLKRMSSFHTPGHKGNCSFISNLFNYDFTELPGLDSLYEANGSILEAETRAAEVLGTKRTLFSAGGCTLCIQAMMNLCAKPGSKIICSRVIHRSAINAMALLDIEPIWIYPTQDAGKGIPGRIDCNELEKLIIDNDNVSAVYITSPNYYGVISNIESISSICQKQGLPLLVDNAHGAHLGFLSRDLHPIHLGATITACSAHKTLPVLTGGAWLNIGDESYISGAKESMALFGSTSPSYPIMASLDLCIDWLDNYGKDKFLNIEEKIKTIRQLAISKGINIPLGMCDPLRVTLDAASIGTTGTQLALDMRRNGIEPEYASQQNVILIATPMNADEDIDRLYYFIDNIEIKKPIKYEYIEIPKTKTIMSPREAMLSDSQTIDVKDSLNRIAAQAPCPCPPGMPVVMFGEIITKDIIDMLLGYGISSIKVVK